MGFLGLLHCYYLKSDIGNFLVRDSDYECGEYYKSYARYDAHLRERLCDLQPTKFDKVQYGQHF